MNKLKELRKAKKISQNTLASFLGVNEKTISRWENGESQINSKKVEKLADYFGVSVAYLLGYTDIPKQYQDEEIVSFNQETYFAYSDFRNEDEKEKYQYTDFVRFLIDNGIFLTNDELHTVFSLIKQLDANNVYNDGKYLFANDVLPEEWSKYKDGKYSNILKPDKNVAYSDLEKELNAYIWDETHSNNNHRKFDTIKATKLLKVLKNAYGEREYLDQD